MSAYVIVNIQVNDPAVYEEYKKLAPATIASYGGRYLARGGKVEILEGSWQPNRLVILEFESMARAREWLDSPEYTPVKRLRHGSANSDMVVVEGVPE
jgi:uncharacterized protein (DUF1330 family)